jgi:hypothetical protein
MSTMLLQWLTNRRALKIMGACDEFFKQFPSLSPFWAETYVMLLPALVGLGAFSGTFGLFRTLFELSEMHFWSLGESGVAWWIWLIFKIVAIMLILYQALAALLLILAFQPLRRHEMNGWIYLFWNSFLGVVYLPLFVLSSGPQSLSTWVWVFLNVLSLYLTMEVMPFYAYPSEKRVQ